MYFTSQQLLPLLWRLWICGAKRGKEANCTCRRKDGGDPAKAAEVTEATLIVAYVRSTAKLKERENRPSTCPGEDGGNEKEERRTAKKNSRKQCQQPL